MSKYICPNCRNKVEFRFHFDLLPGSYNETYPNECPLCGCFANYTDAWVPKKGNKKLNWFTRLFIK